MIKLAQLGRMLKKTPRNEGTKGQLKGDVVSGTKLELPTSDIPTLADLGLDKKTSKLAQDIAELPRGTYLELRDSVHDRLPVLCEKFPGTNSTKLSNYDDENFVTFIDFLLILPMVVVGISLPQARLPMVGITYFVLLFNKRQGGKQWVSHLP